MNKKVSLKKKLSELKLSMLSSLTSYYWMWARTDWKDWYEMMQYVIWCLSLLFSLVYK